MSYTDCEGLIFEFEFSEEAIKDGEIDENCISLIYRVIYSLNNGLDWFNDIKVKYLAEGKTVIGIE